MPYTAFRGGVRVASRDLNADGFADIITSAGPGTGGGNFTPPPVLGLNGVTLGQFHNFNSYDPSFLGGVYVG